MTQEILALCRAMGADQEELLLPLVQAVEEQLARRLKEGVTPQDCGQAFPLAAAMIAMDHLSAMSGGGGGETTSFTAGELSIRKESGGGSGKSLAAQAGGLLAPWLRDSGGFAFQGVEG